MLKLCSWNHPDGKKFISLIWSFDDFWTNIWDSVFFSAWRNIFDRVYFFALEFLDIIFFSLANHFFSPSIVSPYPFFKVDVPKQMWWKNIFLFHSLLTISSTTNRRNSQCHIFIIISEYVLTMREIYVCSVIATTYW